MRLARTAGLRLSGVGLVAASLLCATPASAGLADQVGAAFRLMVGAFVDAFPAAEGLVVTVDGDRLYMDLSEEDGVREGQEFAVFRKGEVFRHPITEKPLGRYEEHLGYARVIRVFPRYSEAVYIPADSARRPAPGDGVRITRGRIRVAVAPLLDLTGSGADLRRVPYLIAVALERTKRFQVVDPQEVADLLAAEGLRVEEILASPATVVSVGSDLGVACWIIPVLLARAGATYLDVTWISAVTGTALFSRRQQLIRLEPDRKQRFPWEPRAGALDRAVALG
ncbi:MAG: hypothetical protein ACE5JN_05205 [Candidatus Methylomirabilia bacterium]